MGTAATIARRTFLLGSAAIAGGVAFGAYLYNAPVPNPLDDGLGEGAVAFNPFVRIDASGITLIAPHTDLGQGVRSLQAMLIAEELDLDPGQFAIETGPPSPAYINTAMGIDLVGAEPGDPSLKARFMFGAFDTIARLAGLQVTGGSTTAADSFTKLREAGAMARETLKHAAARRSGVPVAQLATASGAVVLPDGSKLPYTQLAADAAAIAPVKEVALRHPSRWRLIGKPVQRADIVAKSTGTLTYGLDLKHDGMVYAAVQLNPAIGGALRGFDASAAKQMPGVKDVVEITGGIAAIADSSWNAMQAASAVKCDWGPAAYPAAMADHWAAVTQGFAGKPATQPRTDGDVAAALRGSGVIHSEYKVPYLAHQPLEPLSALVLVTDERVDMWVSSQMPIFARGFIARITGHKEEDTHLHNQYCGGSFGHRLEFENIRHAAEVGARLRGTPVKLIYRREEDFTHDFTRPLSMARFSAAGKDGQVTALDIAVSGPPIMASQGKRAGLPALGPEDQLHAGISNAPYAIPNMRVRTFEVPGLAPVSSWRSVGASANGFYLEGALDEAIIAAGGDPLAERLRLSNSPAARAVLAAVGEMSGWGSALGPGRGRGIALVESFGTPVAEVVEVSDTPGGIRIDKVYVAADVGPVLDPVNFDNLVKGGVIWGLGHAMNCEITFADGAIEQTNFHAFQAMRMNQCPEVFVRAVDTGKRVTGIGEPPVPPAAPALANAIFAATGKRLREMPFSKSVTFA